MQLILVMILTVCYMMVISRCCPYKRVTDNSLAVFVNSALFLVLLGALMNYIWIVTFFATLLVMPMFEGALADENGIKPIVWRFGDKVMKIDTNLFGACLMSVVNTAGLVLAL